MGVPPIVFQVIMQTKGADKATKDVNSVTGAVSKSGQAGKGAEAGMVMFTNALRMLGSNSKFSISQLSGLFWHSRKLGAYLAGGFITGVLAARAAMGAFSVVMNGIKSISAAFSSEIKKSALSFIELENQLYTVVAAANGGMSSLDELKRSVQDTSMATGISSGDIGKSMEDVARAGFDAVDDIKLLSNVLAKFQKANAATPEASSRLIIGALSAFSMEGKDAIRVADIFSKAMTATYLDGQKLADAMQYIGPSFGPFNQSLEEAATWAGVLANMGISGSRLGTSIGAILQKLLAPTKEMTNIMAKYGLTQEEINPVTHTFTQILDTVNQKMGISADTARMFGIRHGANFNILLQELDAAKKLHGEIANSQGFMESQLDIMLSSIQAFVDKAKAAWEVLRQVIGDSLGPIISGVAQRMTETTGNIIDRVRAIQEQGGGAGEVVSVAMEGVVGSIGQMVQEILPQVREVLGESWSSLRWIIGWGIGLVYEAYKIIIMEFYKSIISAGVEFEKLIIDGIKLGADYLVSKFMQMTDKVKWIPGVAIARQTVENAGAGVGQASEALSRGADWEGEFLKGGIDKIESGFAQHFKEYGNNITTELGNILTSGFDAVETAVLGIGEDKRSPEEKKKSVVQDINDKMFQDLTDIVAMKHSTDKSVAEGEYDDTTPEGMTRAALDKYKKAHQTNLINDELNTFEFFGQKVKLAAEMTEEQAAAAKEAKEEEEAQAKRLSAALGELVGSGNLTKEALGRLKEAMDKVSGTAGRPELTAKEQVQYDKMKNAVRNLWSRGRMTDEEKEKALGDINKAFGIEDEEDAEGYKQPSYHEWRKGGYDLDYLSKKGEEGASAWSDYDQGKGNIQGDMFSNCVINQWNKASAEEQMRAAQALQNPEEMG